MTEHESAPENAVSVYDVGGAGETGPRAGIGVLVGARMVLVHPSLGQRLAPTDAGKLRVGIPSPHDANEIVELIDVTKVVVSTIETKTRKTPIVGLELKDPSPTPPGLDLRSMTDGKEDIGAIVACLDGSREVRVKPGVPDCFCRAFPCNPLCPPCDD